MTTAMVGNPTPVAGLVGSRPSSARDGSEQQWELLAMEQEEEDAYLKEIAGVDDLGQAISLQIVINTTTTTVSHLGSKLVNLEELNLNNSVIASLRDLGTGFKSLTVLWISRCGLSGLEGVGAMAALKELYASYNDISDLQQLDACTQLEILDLEGNCVSELLSVIYLSACSNLQSLALEGNPVAEQEDYRQQVCSSLPSLQTLDDVPIIESERTSSKPSQQQRPSSESGPQGAPASHQHAAEMSIVCQGIKHARVGVDSHEFRELEMTMLFGTVGPGSGSGSAHCIPPTAGSDGCISSAGPGGRPCTASAIMPLSAGTWMRALRASQTGNLTAMRASRDAAGGVQGPASTSSAVNSPAHSRPPSAQGADRGSGSAHGAPRPSSASNTRPFSARLGSAALGGGVAGARPGSGASAPPTAGGLYWRKNRLHPPTSVSATESLLSAVAAAQEEIDGGASALTFGGDVIGGVKDLRKRRKAWAPPGSAEGVNSSSSRHAPPVLARMASSGPFGAGVSTSYDTAALLEELKRWKVETADCALMPEEGPSQGAWGVNLSIDGAAENAEGSADILDLGVQGQGHTCFSLSDDMPVGGHHGGSGGDDIDRDSGGSRATLGSREGQRAAASHSMQHTHPPPSGIPGSPLRPGSLNPVVSNRHRTAHRMMLAKVIKDVQAPSAKCPSLAGPGSPLFTQSSRHSEDMVRPPGSPVASHRQHSHAGVGSPLSTRASGIPRPLHQTSGRPLSGHHGSGSMASHGSSSAHQGEQQGSTHGEKEGHGCTRVPSDRSLCRVISVAGEVDLASTNPRPVPRADAMDDYDSDEDY